MSAEIHAPTRLGEWRCACYANIRAASCRQCLKCGMERPYRTGEAIAATREAVEGLDVFDTALRLHGSRTAAVQAVIEWARRRA
jgi:hypothetical protein